MYTIGRAMGHAKTITLNAKSSWFREIGQMCVQDALVEFFSRDWPFLHGEGVVTTTPPYLEGTITTTEGDATLVGVGTTWDPTWPTPAIIRTENGRGEEFLVTSFTNGTSLEIDTPWPYDSEAGVGYTIEFPCYEIPEYLNIDGVMTAYAFKRFVAGNSYKELMAFRHGWLFSGYPAWYAIVPGTANTPTKIWLSPSPNDTYTFRYTYKAAVPDFLIHQYGTATFTAGSPTVTGSTGSGVAATNWNSMGFNATGKFIEVLDDSDPQPFVSGEILSVGGAASITLTANWGGRSTSAGVAYGISPQLNIQDDLIPAFRSLVESYVLARVKPESAMLARQMYQSQLNDALQRYERDAATLFPRGVNGWTQQNDAECGPGMPTELLVRTV